MQVLKGESLVWNYLGSLIFVSLSLNYFFEYYDLI